MRRGGLALIAILVVGSLTKLLLPQSAPVALPGSNKSAATPGAATASGQESDLQKAQESVEWYPSQLRERIRDYFGFEAGPSFQASKPGLKGTGGSEPVCDFPQNWCVPSDFRGSIHFVIAAAPDPVHTHLGLFFDRSIDAIQQGAASRDYLFDRAIMPWQYFVPQDTQETDQEKLVRKVRESYPGLMIFRKQDPKDSLFVFVVGETPTAGINKEQFYRTVEIVHEMREGQDTVRSVQSLDFAVLGPSFSGSLYSLREILKQYQQKYWKDRDKDAPALPVHAVVLATAAIADFKQNAPSQARMTIYAQDAQAALDALFRFASGLGYRDSEIALLNEDDTAYGSGFLPQTQKDALSLSFPRGISQFRSAYSKDTQIQDQAGDANQPQRRNLRLDLELTGSDDDNVAPYAAAQTPLSQEAIMLEIVSELRRRDSKFILIRATDPLDELFLARYLGSQYPDGRLVVPTPDLLFAREEGGVLDGVLGLNTYPVSPAYLNPTCADPRGSLFPAASSVGLYNAMASLAAELSPPATASPAVPGKAAVSTPAGACELSPNLWLTVVTRNRFHPVQVLHASPSTFFPGSAATRTEELYKRDGRIETPWAILCILALALAANHWWRLGEPNPLGYWGTVEPADANSRAAKDRVLWIGALVVVTILVVFACPVTLIPDPWHVSGTWFIVVVLWFCWLALVARVTHDFCKVRNKPILAFSFCVLSVAFTLTGMLMAYGKSSEMVLWQQRTLNLASQVSGVTPFLLLLAASYIWFWFSLKAESLVDWRGPRLPEPSESAAEEIRKVIPSFRQPWAIHAGAGAVTALIALRGVELGPYGIPIRSLEGRPYDAIYSLFFAVALYFLVATLLRALAVWLKLRALLFSLDRPGMAQALDRLKGFGWSEIWNPLESMRDEAARMYFTEFEVVERLQESLGKPPGDAVPDPRDTLRSACAGVTKNLRRIFALLKQGIPDHTAKPEEIIAPVKEVQEDLAQLATALLRDHLEPSWKTLPADDQIPASPQKAPDPPETKIIEARVKEPDERLRASIRAEITGADKSAPSDPSRLSPKCMQLGEELVACVYATFITVALLRIRSLVFSAVMIYTALVFSSASYPFQPAASLRTLALFLFVLGGIIVGYVYEEMHRDESLRRMTSTDPNKIDSALWLKVVSAGLLPLLGLLSALFPAIGHFLYSIAAPILQATR
jgi:hypothetical protein